MRTQLTVSSLCILPKDACNRPWPFCPACPADVPDCAFKENDVHKLARVRSAVESAISQRGNAALLRAAIARATVQAVRSTPATAAAAKSTAPQQPILAGGAHSDDATFTYVLDVECAAPYRTATIGFSGRCDCERMCAADRECAAFTQRLTGTKACLLYGPTSVSKCTRAMHGGRSLTALRGPSRAALSRTPPEESSRPLLRATTRGRNSFVNAEVDDVTSSAVDTLASTTSSTTAPPATRCVGATKNGTQLREWMRGDQGSWAMFMVHTFDGTLPILTQALRAWWRASPLIGTNLIVVDNTRRREAVTALDRSLVRDVVATGGGTASPASMRGMPASRDGRMGGAVLPEPLGYSASMQFVATLAARMQLAFFFSVTPNHYVMRCEPDIDLASVALTRVADVSAISPNWGAILFAHLKFAAFRTQAAIHAPWDPNAPEFGGDCDMLYRMELSGWSRHRSKLCHRISLKGEGRRYVRTLFKVQRVLNITDRHSWLRTLRVLQHEKAVRSAAGTLDDDMLWRISGVLGPDLAVGSSSAGAGMSNNSGSAAPFEGSAASHSESEAELAAEAEEVKRQEEETPRQSRGAALVYDRHSRAQRDGLMWLRAKWGHGDMCEWIDHKIRRSLAQRNSARCVAPWPLCPACGMNSAAEEPLNTRCFPKAALTPALLAHSVQRAQGVARLSVSWWQAAKHRALEGAPLSEFLYRMGVADVMFDDDDTRRNAVIVALSQYHPELDVNALQAMPPGELQRLALDASEQLKKAMRGY